jgi:hypothetical protein
VYVERFGPGGEAFGNNRPQQDAEGDEESEGEDDAEAAHEGRGLDQPVDEAYPCRLFNLPYESDTAEVKTYAEAALSAAFADAQAQDYKVDSVAWVLVSTVVGAAPSMDFPNVRALRGKLGELTSFDLPRGTALLLFTSRAAAAAVASRLDNLKVGGRTLNANTGPPGGGGGSKEIWDGRYWSHGLSAKKRPRGGVQCFRCGGWGHVGRECPERASSAVPTYASSGPACPICARQHSDEERRAMAAAGRPWDHLCPGSMNVHARVELAVAVTANATAMVNLAANDHGGEAIRCIICAGAGHLFCNEGSDDSDTSDSDSSDEAVSPMDDGEEDEVEDAAARLAASSDGYCFNCSDIGHTGEACLASKAAAVQQMVHQAFQRPYGGNHNHNYPMQNAQDQQLQPPRHHQPSMPRLEQERWQRAPPPDLPRQSSRCPPPQQPHQQSQPPYQQHPVARPSAGRESGRLLVLFDLNGTLLHRAPGYTERNAAPPTVAPDQSAPTVAPDHVHGSVSTTRSQVRYRCCMHKHFALSARSLRSGLQTLQVAYYIRPEAKALVATLRSYPNAVVAFYTSMTAANARPAVDCLGGRGLGLYDRPYNALDPDAAESWTSVSDRRYSASRDLHQLLSHTLRIVSTFYVDNVFLLNVVRPHARATACLCIRCATCPACGPGAPRAASTKRAPSRWTTPGEKCEGGRAT